MADYLMGLAELMRAEVDTLNSIAQNSANVNTVGYKAETSYLNSSSFRDSIEPSYEVSKGIDQRSGNLKVTGRKLDVALMGSGWFGVHDVDGTIKLTRNGNFHINTEGVLVNSDQLPIAGVSGEININGEINSVTHALLIDQNGTLSLNGDELDQLAVFEIADDAEISPLGNGLYQVVGNSKRAENYKIIQSALEMSNVDMSADMVRLMETTRHIESIQRAMTSYDQMMDTGVNQIGK